MVCRSAWGAVALALVGCADVPYGRNKFDPDAPIEDQHKMVVTGCLVTTGGAERDVEAARIDLLGAHAAPPVKLADDGCFEFVGVVRGTYLLSATLRGYESASRVVEIPFRDPEKEGPVEVGELELRHLSATVGAVPFAGVVSLNEQGESPAGTLVTLVATDPERALGSTLTDGGGGSSFRRPPTRSTPCA